MADRITPEEALAACAKAAATAAEAAASASRTGAEAASMAARAIETAGRADAAIASHERLCALREVHREREQADLVKTREQMHTENQTGIKEVKESIRKMYGTKDKVTAFIIGLLLCVVGYLIAKNGI